MEENESKREVERSEPSGGEGDVDAALNRLGEIRKSTPMDDPATTLWNRNFVVGIVGVVLVAIAGMWLVLASGPHGDAADSLGCPAFLITIYGDPESSFVAEGCGSHQRFWCTNGVCMPDGDIQEGSAECCGGGEGWRVAD